MREHRSLAQAPRAAVVVAGRCGRLDLIKSGRRHVTLAREVVTQLLEQSRRIDEGRHGSVRPVVSVQRQHPFEDAVRDRAHAAHRAEGYVWKRLRCRLDRRDLAAQTTQVAEQAVSYMPPPPPRSTPYHSTASKQGTQIVRKESAEAQQKDMAITQMVHIG